MKIALVHEFLTQLGGAERVLENFLEIWPARHASQGEAGGPDAIVHVLIYDKDKIGKVFETSKKRVSFLNKYSFARKHHKWFLPLMPRAVEKFNFDEFDVVLSDSSSFAKGAIARGKLNICYCHTPTRFLWTEAQEYLSAQPLPFFIKWIAGAYLPFLRHWDFDAAQRPDFFIANSKNVQNRIKKYYNRESIVIPPPVDTEFFSASGGYIQKQDYFFTASRLEPYKKIELVVQAFNDLGLPLKVAGTGTNSEKLKAMAKPNIEFLGRISDEELRQRYAEARAFIFPADEDAGIMPLEAQACGTPVIAYGAGGSLETVVPGTTGEFFKEQNVESLKAVLKNFDSSKYNQQTIREHAQKFDKKIFQQKIKQFVEEKYSDFQG